MNLDDERGVAAVHFHDFQGKILKSQIFFEGKTDRVHSGVECT